MGITPTEVHLRDINHTERYTLGTLTTPRGTPTVIHPRRYTHGHTPTEVHLWEVNTLRGTPLGGQHPERYTLGYTTECPYYTLEYTTECPYYTLGIYRLYHPTHPGYIPGYTTLPTLYTPGYTMHTRRTHGAGRYVYTGVPLPVEGALGSNL